MSSNSYRNQTAPVTQANGSQSISAIGSCSRHQLHIEGGTSGTLAVKYRTGGALFDLVDSVGAAITIDLASNTKAYFFEGLIDGVVLVPTSVVGNYVAVLRGIE